MDRHLNPSAPLSDATRQAAAWTETLGRAGAHGRGRFDEWLMESPRHVREFLLMSALDRALDEVDPERRHDVQALLKESAGSVVSLQEAAEHRQPAPGGQRRGRRLRWAAAAALGALTVAGSLLATHRFMHPTYSTGIGEQRTFQLADGSIVYLNTRTRLRVEFSGHERSLRLLEGQALFKVQPDRERPFRVQTGDASIRVLGTQFDVYRRADATTTVSVLEGAVKVSTGHAAENVSAGTAAHLAADGSLRLEHDADVAAAVAWRQRRLKFRRDTLAEVVAEFNRYNREPQLRLDDNLASIAPHYSGEFDADDPQSLLQLLATDDRLSVNKKGGEIVIRARPAAPPSPGRD